MKMTAYAMLAFSDTELKSCLNSANQFQPKKVGIDLANRIIAATSFLPQDAALKQRYYTILMCISSTPKCANCENPAKWDKFKNIYREYCGLSCHNNAMRGDKGKLRAKNRKSKIIDVDSIDELKSIILRKDGHINGNISQEKNLTQNTINVINSYIRGDCPIDVKIKLICGGKSIPLCDTCGVEILISKSSDLNKQYCSVKCSNSNIDKIQKTKDICVDRYGVTSNLVQGIITPEKQKLLNSNKLLEWYVDHNLNAARIADMIGVSPSTVGVYLKRLCDDNNISYIGTRSMLEKRIEDMFSNSELYFSTSCRTAIPPYEIDLYNSRHRIGIEVHGDYWHSDKFKDKYYHAAKATKADQNAIRLYQFFEHEILSKPAIIHDMIMSNISEEVIWARKCKVVELDSKQYGDFVSRNHIQGTVHSSHRLGLVYGDELVACAGFGKPRFSKKHDWELLRFCSNGSLTIVGGFSRILHHFKKNHRGSIVSFADRRFSSMNNNVYIKCGFTLSHITKPGYFYANNGIIKSRYQTQKHKLPKLLGMVYDNKLTEEQNMKNANFNKIWDAGQLVYIMENN